MKEKVRRRALVTGVHANLYEGPEPGTLVYFFKDEIALAKKPFTIPGKGVLNNRISSFIHEGLGSLGVPTTYLNMSNMREQMMLEASVLPMSVIVRNILTGPRAKSLGVPTDMSLPSPMIDYVAGIEARASASSAGGAFLSAQAVVNLGWADEDEMEEIAHIASRANDYLTGLFHGAGFQLVDVCLQFGRLMREYCDDTSLVLCCQFTPENSTLIDLMEKVRYPLDDFYRLEKRRKAPNLLLPYEAVARRLSLMKPRTKAPLAQRP